jgi:hypothetical protein
MATNDDEFENDDFEEQDSWSVETFDNFLKYCTTETELRQTIKHLIEYRELLRDEEIERLFKESSRLLERLQRYTDGRILEEIECFRDIVALQRKLIDADARARR